MRSGKVKVLFKSNPVEFKPESVIIELEGGMQEISNDFVFIFAGGTPSYEFLKKVGVGFGNRDLILEASKEAAKQARPVKLNVAQASAGAD